MTGEVTHFETDKPAACMLYKLLSEGPVQILLWRTILTSVGPSAHNTMMAPWQLVIVLLLLVPQADSNDSLDGYDDVYSDDYDELYDEDLRYPERFFNNTFIASLHFDVPYVILNVAAAVIILHVTYSD